MDKQAELKRRTNRVASVIADPAPTPPSILLSPQPPLPTDHLVAQSQQD